MMRLQVFKYLLVIFFCAYFSQAQNIISGHVVDSITNNKLGNVQLFDKNNILLTVTNESGDYYFETFQDNIEISFVKNGYSTIYKKFNINNVSTTFNMALLSDKVLEEINITDDKNNLDIAYLKDFSTTSNSIYSGKKSELILPKNKSGTASNNARKMYNKTVSLNIYQTDDAGLQLNIGGRGLDPRRTSNFNVRQNGYEISAEPLGYPESYYVPPFECLESIEIVRGAGSLQYGTQFGGLLNFNIKKPVLNKNIELLTRRTLGSFGLYANFTSLSGTTNRTGYYAFYNSKTGNGFRPNSYFDSKTAYSFFSYQLNSKLNMSFEFTYMDYLAQQPGGLTDQMFEQDIFQSIRERNWMTVNWLLYNIQVNYSFSENTNLSFSSYLLDAHRYAVGFRTNKVNMIDQIEERDLIKSDFNNLGFETKLLHTYRIFDLDMVSLLGAKFYSGKTLIAQGPGSNGRGPHFDFELDIYPTYVNQSEYENPNVNYAFFNENIIYLNKKMSLVPGFRIEYINTSSDGYYYTRSTDLAGNILEGSESFNETSQVNPRSFVLFALGYSFKIADWTELYANCAQNYRSVTFSDINIKNPSFIINPNIEDESGYTFDIGFRGSYKGIVFYDLSYFNLFYNDRIGFIQKTMDDFSIKNEKGNVGDANILGQEILLNFNLDKLLKLSSLYDLNYFINVSALDSEYIDSDVNGIQGKQVEFVPDFNLKTGLEIGYKNIAMNIQYNYMSQQFTDASNAVEPGNLGGIIGVIPKYDVLDISLLCWLNNYKLEFGVNNLLDEYYFTNRAAGYPGPGIIPSPTRNFYVTFEYKF